MGSRPPRSYRTVAVIAVLTLLAGRLAWRYRGEEAGTVWPSPTERACARLMEWAGQERASLAARRVALATKRLLCGGATARENQQLAIRAQLLRDQVRAAETQPSALIRFPGLGTERDDLIGLYEGELRVSVVGRPGNQWSDALILNAGRDGDVCPGDVVVMGPHYVGTIVRANRSTSTVLLVTDPQHAIGVRGARSEEFLGVAQGSAGGPVVVGDVPSTADVREGDLVLTSGQSGHIPGGLIVGVVTGYHRALVPSGPTALATVTVEPTAGPLKEAHLRVLRAAPARGPHGGS